MNDSQDLSHVPGGDDVVFNCSSGLDNEVREVIFISNLQGLEAVPNVGTAREVLGVDEVDHVLEGEAL